MIDGDLLDALVIADPIGHFDLGVRICGAADMECFAGQQRAGVQIVIQGLDRCGVTHAAPSCSAAFGLCHGYLLCGNFITLLSLPLFGQSCASPVQRFDGAKWSDPENGGFPPCILRFLRK